MTNLYTAMTSHDARTTNGAVTHSTSGGNCVDLFFKVGASRGKDLMPSFIQAFYEDTDIATRIMLWSRDVRGGSGEREHYRSLLKELEKRCSKELLYRVMNKAPLIGRWDDILVVETEDARDHAAQMVAVALEAGDGLCAKWMPREKSADKETAKWLRERLGLYQKDYRKLIAGLSNTVEQNMCAKKFTDIDYSKIPSLAQARYASAFKKNDLARYAAYLESVEKGDAKINAGAVYPYDIARNIRLGNSKTADLQWNALPNWLEGSDENIMPVIDVSGSMYAGLNGGTGFHTDTSEVTCMDVAISLGLYISERSNGIFKDCYISFSDNPLMHRLKGSLSERYKSMQTTNQGYSTDIEKTFKVLLDKAVRHGVPQSEMPTKLLLISDMEFNASTRWNVCTNYESIRRMYLDAGYEMPNLVFWNVNARAGNVPVKINDEGVALVSGFSPAIMQSLLGGTMSPEKVMLDTVLKERYNY